MYRCGAQGHYKGLAANLGGERPSVIAFLLLPQSLLLRRVCISSHADLEMRPSLLDFCYPRCFTYYVAFYICTV